MSYVCEREMKSNKLKGMSQNLYHSSKGHNFKGCEIIFQEQSI
jgi:hypothetical protein